MAEKGKEAHAYCKHPSLRHDQGRLAVNHTATEFEVKAFT